FHTDAAIEKAVNKAFKIVQAQHPSMPTDEQRRLAKIIGVGAIKFYLAKFDLERDITIAWDDLLNFEGNACPYVQYSCVRAKSIISKAKSKNVEVPDPDLPLNAEKLQKMEEKALYHVLARFPSKVLEISKNLNVYQLPLFALEIADKFNKFYHECPILKENVDPETRNARLLLVQDTINIFQIILEKLLGIQIPDKM
ncbi:MAG: DALR anticodon-binding domain-containing protein, partial [Promethearchaeota archaeon]